ncbi:hypothetical protein B5S31_g2527 [[Candida] boidinii]|nr:hypothetical protein B5S31_g2527 [[Candida] boidinii]
MSSYITHMDTIAEKLQDNSLDLRTKHSFFSELCDTLETYNNGKEHEYFLKKFMPIFLKQLELVPISFTSNSQEHKLRNLILNIIHRLPTNESFQDYTDETLSFLIKLIKEENEENGIQCLKIITSLHKSYKDKLSSKVNEFIDIILEIYSNIPNLVDEQFGDSNTTTNNSNGNSNDTKNTESNNNNNNTNSNNNDASSPSSNTQNTANSPVSMGSPMSPPNFHHHDDTDSSKTLNKAMKSFKILAECPITMVSLCSTYKEIVNTSLPKFIPKVIELLRLQALKQKRAHELAKTQGKYMTNVTPEIKNRSTYDDFIIGQVKAASFLAFVFIRKSAHETLEPFHNEIPDLIIRLLQDCPYELSSARRELLHATRHILSTDYKTLFFSKIDMLLDDRVIIGEGFTAHETLRPLAYSIVADFIHVNSNLTSVQIWKSVTIYCKHLQDPTLDQTVHIMSAKLLLNLVERILKLDNKAESRQLFLILIDAFTKRFNLLNNRYDDVMLQHSEFLANKSEKSNIKKEWNDKYEKLIEPLKLNGTKKEEQGEKNSSAKIEEIKEDKMDTSDDIDDDDTVKDKESIEYYLNRFSIQRNLPITISQPSTQDQLQNTRYLFRTLMTFLKSVFYGIRNSNPDPPKDYNAQTWNEFARVLNGEELNILKDLFKECILGLRFFQSSKPSISNSALKQSFDITGPNLPVTSSKEEKDLMEIFATMFIYIEPSSFNEIVSFNLEFLFDSMLENAALLHIPQFFLASEITTSNFSGLLINFVMSKLYQLGEMDIIKSNILIRLFKLCFMSVNLFPTANESVILPHLNKMILKSLEYTTTAREPIVYFYLIRTLFRSIGGGRFESLYKEILPLLQVLLESLNRLIQTARRPQERDIYVELCLTVPVRLSVLVPHLNYLMRPLVFALNGSQELISQGLRTLELCVDNLTAEYFDPIIEPVIDDVMKALWKHLRPLPYYHQHSHTTLRVLGKLGGRNRSFFKLHNDLQSETPTEQEVKALFKIENIPNEVPVSMTAGVSTALNFLVNVRYKLHYRISAYKYLSSILKLFIDKENVPENLGEKVQMIINFINADSTEGANFDDVHLEVDIIKDTAKFDRQEELLVRLLEALFYAVSIEEVKDDAQILIKGICEHYVLLYFGKTMVEAQKFHRKFSVNNHEGKNALNENTIFDAVSYALSSHNKEVHDAGIEAIKIIFNSCSTLLSSVETATKFMPIRRMCSKFVHCCFEEAYYSKLGGCIGLYTLINDLDIPVTYFSLRQIEICRAMFFVLRDTPPDVPSEVCKVAKSIILKLLKDCNKEVSKNAVFQPQFQTIVSLIVLDLSNSNPIVRETSQEALTILSEATQVPISTMISPVKSILLAPIFGKPLRALPFHMQIGNIDAIRYCLSLENTFLEFNDELNRLLSEALALVDADDESLISAHRMSEHKISEQLIKLRVVCIELLSLALTKQEFASSNNQIRIRILGVFFKTLCVKSREIIKAAHNGLKKVLSQNNKLPKELLQNGLRPMLMNLSDHKKLTVSGLEALSSLLELLISYFKVEIGRKLLDHLMAWAQPPALQKIAVQDLENNPTVQIIVAILNIFHLLPPQAYTFMEELIRTLLYLEGHLRRNQFSPFREPIAKFLNRFHEQSTTYFVAKFQSRIYGSRFAYFVGLPEAKELRDHVKKNLLSVFIPLVIKESNKDLKSVKYANIIDLITAIGNQDGDWLKSQKQLIKRLFAASNELLIHERGCALVNPIHLQLNQTMRKLQLLYINSIKLDSNVIDDMVDDIMFLIEYTHAKTIKLIDEVENFIFDNVVKNESIEVRQKFLYKVIHETANAKVGLRSKVYYIKYVVFPVCKYEYTSKKSLKALAKGEGSYNWLNAISECIWKSPSDADSNKIGYIDAYRLELLQLTSFLVKESSEIVNDHRKDIIKFNWNLITLDDTITKQAAYVSTSYFIAAFETPPKVATQIFVALLRANQSEIKYLVREALDIIAPVMEVRMKPTGSNIGWLRWPRRVLSEDGFNISQVLNIYQFIVHYSDLFYVARDQFIPNIISAMGKLLLNNNSSDNTNLAIDLAELLLKWETRAKEELDASKAIEDSVVVKSEEKSEAETEEKKITEADDSDKMDIDEKPEGKSEDADKEKEKEKGNESVKKEIKPEVPLTPYTIPFGQRESCVTFLIRFICIFNQRASENEIGQRALRILRVLLSPSFWPEVSVKLSFFERFLVAPDFSTSNVLGYCLNALEVLHVALEMKSSEWIISNLAYLQKLLEKCIQSDNHDIQEALQKVLEIILGSLKERKKDDDEEEEPDDIKAPLNFIVNTISDDLNNVNSVAAGVALSWTLAQYFPEYLDPLIPVLIKTLAKLVKDHISLATQFNNNTNPTANNAEYEAKMTSKLLTKLLKFSAMRISVLGDQRRNFLSILVQLIDRSVDRDLLMKVIEICRGWIFSSNELFPTVKEKAGILTKMMVFDLKGDTVLSKAFYQTIVDIFNDKSLSFTELTVRMEQPFLVGTKLSEVTIRQELMSILDSSLDKDINKRLFYVIREQNWEYLADYPWLNQAVQLLYGAFAFDHALKLDSDEYKLNSLSSITDGLPEGKAKVKDVEVTDVIKSFVDGHLEFLKSNCNVKAKDVIVPLLDISYQSPETIHNSWLTLFPIAYKTVESRDKPEFLRAFVTLLSKDYHSRQQDNRMNNIFTMLEAAGKCQDLHLPPHLVKYLGANYNSWYSGIRILEEIEEHAATENPKIRETNRDALVEMYSSLQDDDMFYGLWRRRAKYFETNAALSYEQIGLWDQAIKLYENAQIKARSGVLPYSESEYAVWEDNWILCAEKLQHWDILTELAKHEGFTDLLLECGWRIADWISDREPLEQSVKTVMDVPTPRRQMFQTFLCLQGYAHNKETIQNVTRYCDEGIQLAIRKWHSLPQRVTSAHIPLLHSFQQYVEFMEASQVYRSLASTTAQNLDVKSQELKRVLQAWRERLPNVWDDINIWNDLVTWRQHAFNVINKVYMPLIPSLQQNNNNNNSYAFRGFHEIAWVINRFAHVARQHNMPEVCINQLTKIYTLPNIEIQEAFLKLREQAKCHYQNPKELNTGLDVISNTNLVYFGAQQKAEFITLKGMFLAKLHALDEANQAFATAVQLDLNLPKAWAEWGFFNDNRFKETNDISYAKHSISCYLQAAGLYKNNKARRLLCRILWLIGLDDSTGTLAETFESHQGEVPVWHWITFIPQLVTSLSHKEAKLVRELLIRIAKSYPQALHFQLRTTREDFAIIRRQVSQRNGTNPNDLSQSFANVPISQRQPWQHVEEIMGILKTAYPLLSFSLESLVDHISQRFKCDPDSDAYRLVVALYNDGVQSFNRLPNPREDARLPPTTEANIVKFASSVLPKHICAEFEADVIQSKPNLETYISKLRKWRDCLEEKLDRSFGKVNLERICLHLSQFHHQKFEDIEVPGQYLLNKESNAHFVKIERFMPTLQMIRGAQACYKRLVIRAHDGSLHTFSVQYPAARHCRREERIFQLFRIFNNALSSNVQARHRNIELTLPIAVPLSPHIRIMSDDERYINMLSIYEEYCRKKGQNRDEPLAYTIERLHAAYDPRLPKPDLLSVKTEILAAIQSMFVPTNVLKNYFINHYIKFEDFWIFRKQFTSQYASFIFMTYMLSIHSRQPQKIHINQGSGKVWTSEMLPYKVASGKVKTNAFENSSLDVSSQRAAPLICNTELVPFRLTPNIQKLIGEAGLEGILAMHILIITQCLSDPEYEIEHFLSLFIRDEIVAWFTQQHVSNVSETQIREIVRVNVEYIVKRITQLGHVDSNNPGISSHNVLDLFSRAVNPRNLANADTLWMAYF